MNRRRFHLKSRFSSFFSRTNKCIDRMSASNECTSTYACEDVGPPSTDASLHTIGGAPSLSRKRLAARRLPPIVLVTHPTFCSADSDALAQLTPLSSQESVKGDDADTKRQRLVITASQPGGCVLPEVVDAQSGTPFGSPERDDGTKVCGTWPNINNTIVCGYQLVGAGKEFTAFHKETKLVKICQLIDNEQYQKVLKMRERLNEAHKYWKFDDVDEMREFVLPSETEVCEDEYGRRFMFSPWQHGTLQRKVQAAYCMLSELEVQPLFKQIVRAIAFCHTIGVVVRDLKLRKFIFTDKELTRLRLHDVFDLFVCEDVNNDGVRDRHSCPAYVAPEILIKGPAEYAGRPADVWALGVLLYVLLFGRYPFNDVTPQRLFSRILKARFCIPVGASVSYAARALIYGMLRKEPNERPTAKQLLHMPWISTTTETLSKQIKFGMAPFQLLGTGRLFSLIFFLFGGGGGGNLLPVISSSERLQFSLSTRKPRNLFLSLPLPPFPPSPAFFLFIISSLVNGFRERAISESGWLVFVTFCFGSSSEAVDLMFVHFLLRVLFLAFIWLVCIKGISIDGCVCTPHFIQIILKYSQRAVSTDS
ncbi:Tribbles -like protein 2 [Toxocara canis]|uniref:Tribbles-like protein 2 n=1 Tax=Toxocara canis TaxID=6265 RepID=A0A0B2VMJ3_TOXCA|nr:Tribbles -like protein 2 [Toxocara canis]